MQQLRDLQWVAQSRSFIAGTHVAAPLLPADQAMPDVDAAQLSAFLAERSSHRVGYYFEALLLFWLQEVCGLEIVGAGMQIREAKRTVGELDLVFRDEQGALTHWEASVKFFLHHPRPATSHFPGPNARDNFEAKMAKLFDQQLPLSVEHLPEVTVRQAVVKGTAFYHPTIARPDALPERMALDHATGVWIRSSEMSVIANGAWTVGLVATKPWWLAPPTSQAWIPKEQLIAGLRVHFADVGHPVMVWLATSADDVTPSCWFVVGDNWPRHHHDHP